ncbi:interleukin-6 [Carettochelys insculpta]|uniref:interleukin-6 n=1 Tax=Carettochelys insculpta TaxID=44489 RepID=UPI003EBC4793
MNYLWGCSLWAAAAALTMLLGARAAPILDASGEEEFVNDPNRNLLARSPLLPGCESLAWLLHSQAASLKNEICEEFTDNSMCDNSMEMLAQNDLKMPKIKEEDGCLLSGFNEEKCLRGISSGLFTFQIYLKYVKETLTSEKQKVESICYGAKHLANTVKQMLKNPDAVNMPDPATRKKILDELKSNKKWVEKIVTHLILRDFTSFMEKTVRAIRYLKKH